MKHILILMKKQCRDTLKNMTVLIQFLLFPLLAILMTRAIQIEGMPDNFFVNLFATMYIGMAPLTSISAIIAEEKEKNTLRVLLMAGVSPAQYLLGIGTHVFCSCMLGSAVFCCLRTGTTGPQRILFLLIMAVGILTSITLGAAIGVGSKDQMSATSVTVPVMMVFSFLPMLSMFNGTIGKIAKITYSEQISLLLGSLAAKGNYTANVAVILFNMLLFCILFSVLYRKRGLT